MKKRKEQEIRIGEVYVLTNLKNGKEYVGKGVSVNGKGGATRRWGAHIRDARPGKSDLPIHRAIRKYGTHNFSAEVIWCGPEFKACEKEIYFIDKRRTMTPSGYNLTVGGEGQRASKALRKQMSATRKRYFEEHPEAREQIRRQVLAQIESGMECSKKFMYANIGRVYSKVERRVMVKRGKARGIPPECIEAAIKANTGITRSLEQREAHGEFVSDWWTVKSNRTRIMKSLKIAGLKRRGVKRDPEASARAAEKNRGKKRTREQCARISAAAIKRNARPGFKESVSAGLKRYFENPENREKNRQAQLAKFK